MAVTPVQPDLEDSGHAPGQQRRQPAIDQVGGPVSPQPRRGRLPGGAEPSSAASSASRSRAIASSLASTSSRSRRATMPTTRRPRTGIDLMRAPAGAGRVGDVGLLGQRDDVPCHGLGRDPGCRPAPRGLGRDGPSGREPARGDQVGLGQNPDQLAGVHHRHGADAMGDQDVGDLLERHARRHRHHGAGHDLPTRTVASLQRCPSLNGGPCRGYPSD